MEADPDLKQRRLESHRKSYERRRERCIKKTMEYIRQHPDRRRQYSRTTAANRRSAKGSYTTEQWVARFNFYGGRCAYCRAPVALSTVHRDHVIPLARGGPNWASNLVPSCVGCNLRKSTKLWLPSLIST